MDVSFTISADLAELQVVREQLQSLQASWRLPPKTLAEINLVLEELIVNIVSHGRPAGSRVIDISLSKHDQELTMTIADDGPPFDPTGCPPPDITLPLEKRACGGLGIHLVQHFCRCCSYQRTSGRNLVTLRRTLPKECR